ncbi:MAG TPA: hypothetical protein VFF03_00935 [Rhodocyclaceae bacterium]|nr:hypothetical protein [Rhodocyclaceae bacterium]
MFSEEANPLTGKKQVRSCEIDKNRIGGNASGVYSMHAQKDRREVLRKDIEVRPGDGNIASGSLRRMLETPSVVQDDYAVSYGFYDAGIGKKHQSYMYVTDDYSDWMGMVLQDKHRSDFSKRPFGTFVLPGSHDAGMFCGLDSDEAARDLVDRLVQAYSTPGRLAAALAGGAAAAWAAPAAAVLAAVVFLIAKTSGAARRALINLAYTQKDDIKTQLALGTRFFDFRPGYNAAFYRSDQKLRHQHGFIPGYEFEGFLRDVVGFLTAHEKEIVVVQIKNNGFFADDMTPAPEVIDKAIDAALKGSSIRRGDVTDLSDTTGGLLAAGKRLIILKKSDKATDSYSDDAYATDDPESVKAQLDKTLHNLAPDAAWTILQLQGTCTNKPLVQLKGGIMDIAAGTRALAALALTQSDAASPLLSTKARFDHVLYQWLMDENVAKSSGPKPVVLLNDFVDGALTSHAWAMTKQRYDSLGKS